MQALRNGLNNKIKMNILNKLDWSDSKKDECAGNVRKAFWINKTLWNAYEWVKYIDTKTPEVWLVAVIDRWVYWNSSDNWNKYWHVAVITDIDSAAGKIRLFDGPNAYHFWTNIKNISWYITLKKMNELGSPITNNVWFYEEIFKREIKKSSFFNDLETAKSKLGDVAYFVAIWLERTKNNTNGKY